MRIIVAKVGGSLGRRGFEKLGIVINELKTLEDAVVVIPGGWAFADISRLVDVKLNLNSKLSHAMGILSMEMYAHIIMNFGLKGATLKNLKKLEKGEKFVLLPYSSKLHESELPKSWDVTSDSIAVWVAHRLKLAGYSISVIKITDVDGIFKNGRLLNRVKAHEISRGFGDLSCIDSYALKLIQKLGIKLFVCRWDRVKDYIVEGKMLGTLIE
jgi:aspartokinase-like uncharacterized kinase